MGHLLKILTLLSVILIVPLAGCADKDYLSSAIKSEQIRNYNSPSASNGIFLTDEDEIPEKMLPEINVSGNSSAIKDRSQSNLLQDAQETIQKKQTTSGDDITTNSPKNPESEKDSLYTMLRELCQPRNPTYRINNGDLLEISVSGDSDTTREIMVRPDGYLNYLYNIEVRAAGLTYEEFKQELTQQLRNYYRNPDVTVIGKSFSGSLVYVMGPIKNPGEHSIQNNTSLLQVLAKAGVMSLIPQTSLTSANSTEQTNDVVNLQRAYMVREGHVLPINFEKLILAQDMRYNIYVQPNDFIFFPSSYLLEESKRAYVCGTVAAPHVYRFTTYGTFMSAIASSGGVLQYRADLKRCLIIRKSRKEPIIINYYDIIKGKLKDIPLEDSDIVYIPDRKLYKGSRWVSTVLSEIVAPLQSIINADTMLKMYNGQNWKLNSNVTSDEKATYDPQNFIYGSGR